MFEINPHFSPGSGILGQAGKAGWTIGRRGIVNLRRYFMYQGADRSRCTASLFQNPDRTKYQFFTISLLANYIEFQSFPS
jgi:hypothetical protein